MKSEERFDGKYVLRTNTSLLVEEVALRYKELWEVERIFREVKSVFETRPIYHKYDSTIKGHVFCSFLALVIMKELQRRVDFKADWDEIRQDLDSPIRSTYVVPRMFFCFITYCFIYIF